MRENIIEVIARAIIQDDTKTKILFCTPTKRNIAKKYFYLPGGHVEFAETAKTALTRELYEETGVVNASEAEFHFVGTEENIFTQGNVPHHEINVYFEVRGIFFGNNAVPSLEEEISFHWLPIADVPDLPILPEEIKHFLSDWKTGKQISWEK